MYYMYQNVNEMALFRNMTQITQSIFPIEAVKTGIDIFCGIFIVTFYKTQFYGEQK